MAALCVCLAQMAPYTAVELPFVHQPSKTSRKYLPESVSGGVALIDFDNDGRLDIYLVNGAALRDPMPKGASPDKQDPKYWNRLYRNNPDGTFTDVTEKAGVQGSHYGMGAAAADFDNDGDTDLYVTGFGANQLFRNNGDGTFTDITEAAGVRGAGWSAGAAWVDVDHDGHLDLAVTRYMQWDFEPDHWCGAREPGYRSYCNPDRYPPATHLLYRNLGNGKFADSSEASGFGKAPGKGLGIAIADYDLDGKIDIAVANDAAPQQLFRNLGRGRFEEVAFEANAAYDEDGRTFSGMGIEFEDYDDDGRPDLLINALAQQRYALFRNTAQGFEYVSPATALATLTRNHSGWGMRLADMDNDGHKDIVAAQSHVMDNITLTQPAVPYREPLLLLRRQGTRYVDATPAAGPAFNKPRAARGAAVGDLNNDGTLDIVVSSQLEPAVVLRRAPSAHHWLLIKLVGTSSNRDGIGARIRIVTKDRTQYRTVSPAGSYLSSNDPRAHFGLGAATVADTIEVTWPSGKQQTLTAVAVDQVLTVREP
jgi:hypothetical protein